MSEWPEPSSSSLPGDDRGRPTRVEDAFVAATNLALDDPDRVAAAVEQFRERAEEDHRAGTPRGRAYVRRLQALLVENPRLGIAVARAVSLEHIAQELLEGTPVEGVPGIGPDGVALTSTGRHRTRRKGALILALSAVVLLVEAVTADALASILLYLWTAVGLGLFFVGGYLVLLQ
jgi:hypothetical protein